MAIKSFTRSTIENNIFYRSMLAGNTAYNPSDEDILAEEILTSAQASVTFSGLDTLAAGYKHLQIRATIRTDRTGAHSEPIKLNINSDTGTNYAYHALYGYGTGIGSNSATTQDRLFLCDAATSASAVANNFGATVCDILDAFETTKYKTIRSLAGWKDTSYGQIELRSGVWQNTAAITTLTFDPLIGSNFLSGSSFTLIGVK